MVDQLVETRFGTVLGTTEGSVNVWKGIPYAQPPVGPLRFRAPVPLEPWVGVRDATAFGPVAPQDISVFGGASNAVVGEGSAPVLNEDCLYLNIWAPAGAHKPRPVLVWIHGGAFILGSGSSPDYDGATFAAHGDVIVVTLNYRLGALGFLYLGDLSENYASSGNSGLLDQVAALQWVHANIAAFGGDPANVTVFGESAGAMSIGTLLALPEAHGLFQRAILESGAASMITSRQRAIAVRQEFFQELNLQDGALDALASVAVDDLLAAQKSIVQRRGITTLCPVIDGSVLSVHPLEAIASGTADGIVTLIGTNLDEMKLFTALGTSSPTPNEQALQQVLGVDGSALLTAYATLRELPPQEAWVSMLTDKTFRLPALQLADALVQRGMQVWMYRFDWATPAFGGGLGACHALEVPFVWDHLRGSQLSMFIVGTVTPQMQQLAERMHNAWIAFAHSGQPAVATLPAWPAYDTQSRTTMIFNEACHVENDPQAVERQFWAQHL
ncbi:carboxylesterase [Ktedonobacteria bacterium brp13]|nr:carboxylesterase [Ktedonobacteria bacterium brp13]